jgi:hypothetical protein
MGLLIFVLVEAGVRSLPKGPAKLESGVRWYGYVNFKRSTRALNRLKLDST